jgi:hypothetical protein
MTQLAVDVISRTSITAGTTPRARRRLPNWARILLNEGETWHSA